MEARREIKGEIEEERKKSVRETQRKRKEICATTKLHRKSFDLESDYSNLQENPDSWDVNHGL